ncbi:hypothetical protein [Rhizobium sp. 2MFCol3.1]|uniref:hypothetical protein n=1 Tax=Rhizobium sp. 2MFCol3.1 TaxID=1246459 RepID=UPI0003722D70|nr:hypothetical protein [Rhizobium sp. 2MFCol3.1]
MAVTEAIFDFDLAEMLDSDEAIETYLDEVLKTGDAALIASAPDVVLCAKRASDNTVGCRT